LSQFEYITVLTSFVVAFGVSQLLAGWGRLYLNRANAPPYPLQLAASVLLLIALLQSLWGYWNFRDVEWDFGRFLVVLAPLLPLVGAAYLILPSGAPGTSSNPREHYLAVHRVIFGLLAVWVLLGTVTEFVLVEAQLHEGQVFRLVAVALLFALGMTSRPALHWVGLVGLGSLQALFVLFVTPTLK